VIAREYSTGFETTFEIAVPTLQRDLDEGLSWSDAIVDTFLTLLVSAPDTHIARRAGLARAEEVSSMARRVLEAGGVGSSEGRLAIDDMDGRLRGPGNLLNPGATADLTAAAIFVALVEGGWPAGRGGPHEAAR
jgi:triphosphoribosyl-dephospho-CoA synthase